MVAHEWRTMEPMVKAVWEDESRIDKARYETEKARFKMTTGKGNARRFLKDPAAPKRPMSAFLAYSNSRRADLKKKNPTATNADLSKMLSVQWKEISPEDKATYVESEAGLRKQYKSDISTWRRKRAAETKSFRRKQEVAVVKQGQEREVLEAVAKRMSEQHGEPDQQQQQFGQGYNDQMQFAGAGGGFNMLGMPGFMAGLTGNAGNNNVFLPHPLMARNAQQFFAQQLMCKYSTCTAHLSCFLFELKLGASLK
jgi:hypothetical protein